MKIIYFAATLLLSTAIAGPSLQAQTDRMGQSQSDSQSQSGVPAQRDADPQTGEMTTATKAKRTAGIIDSVDASDNEIELRLDAGVKRRFTLNSSVLISDGENVLTFSDLRPGDAVAVVQDGDGEVTQVVVVPVQ